MRILGDSLNFPNLVRFATISIETPQEYRLDIGASYCVIRHYPLDGSLGTFVALDGDIALQLHDMLDSIALRYQYQTNRKNRGWVKGAWRSAASQFAAETDQQLLLRMAFSFYKQVA